MTRTVSKADTANSLVVPKRVNAATPARGSRGSMRKCKQPVIRQHSCRRASAMRDQALQEPGKLCSRVVPLAIYACIVVTARCQPAHDGEWHAGLTTPKRRCRSRACPAPILLNGHPKGFCVQKA